MTKRELVIIAAGCAGWLLFGAALAYHLIGRPDFGARVRQDCEAVARELGYLPLRPNHRNRSMSLKVGRALHRRSPTSSTNSTNL